MHHNERRNKIIKYFGKVGSSKFEKCSFGNMDKAEKRMDG